MYAWNYSLERIGNEVRKEINRAIEKHGFDQTPLNPDMDRRDAYIITSEEHGEVARALTYDGVNRHKLEEEIIQTIAMNVCMLMGIREKAIRDTEK